MKDSWETPAFVEINLDAEIGSYQDDFADDPTPFAAPREAAGDERDGCA